MLAFGISWLGFLPVLAASYGALPESILWNIWLVLPACGPALAAALTLRLNEEQGDALSRLRDALHWRAETRWYCAAVLLPASILAAAQGVSRLLWPDHAATLAPSTAAGVLSQALLSLGTNVWEELGWRGFAQRRLQIRYNALAAALAVGGLWGLWHIPLFLWPGSPMSAFPFWPWFAAVIGRACILAWVYNRAGQSVAVATVYHISANIGGAAIGVHSYAGLAVVEIAVALAVIWRSGAALGFVKPTPCAI